MMPMGVWAYVLWMLFVIMTGIVLLIWGWRSGQFRNVEEPKYRMLRDKEPEDWPGRKGGGS